ncbi:hypothetical protein H5410_028261 [Solanum commersonii]|uniref:Uncharacterized protein n=1 Tax=Solanum commersonii TaxID=4109 RepID=A0A9J5Z1K4_SOLCO|nr:hypothetical protein H5410_028261 [Solanum commersonii]
MMRTHVTWTEATTDGHHGSLVGLVGILCGSLIACMACPCYVIGRLQKHNGDDLWGDQARYGGDCISLVTKALASAHDI